MALEKVKPAMPRKIAFVAMPFGKRPSNLRKEGVPITVDFNAIWDKAIAPALEELGYAVIRADEQSGSVIIKDMLEQLIYADLVIADISVSNANVYYEAGVRHVAKEQGCVLIGAEWAEPVFDLGQIRQVRYPYTHETSSENDFEAIKKAIKEGVEACYTSKSPVYELTDYPNLLTFDRASSFQKMANELAVFQQSVRVARLKSGESSEEAVVELVKQFHSTTQNLDSVVAELLALVRDRLGWHETLTFIDQLPSDVQSSAFVQEQFSLAKAKVGEVEESIATLEQVINQFGGTPERYGLLGGRYKTLFYGDDLENREYYLDQAILNYQTGMNLDLNEYYCACNLPRLLKSRGHDTDEKKAKFIANLVIEVCDIRINQNKMDGWERPTLLGAAFDTEDVEKAKKISAGITKKNQESWHIKTTLKDLQHSLELSTSVTVKTQLESLMKQLGNLI